MVRGEHDADAGDDGVEGPVRVGEGFGVGLLPAEPGAAPGGELAADGEELGGEVRGGDLRTGEGRGDGGVPGPGGDVEDALARADAGRPDEIGAEAGDDLGGDRRVVARRPHGAVAGLELDVLVEHLLTHGEPPSVGCSQGPGGAGRPPVPRLYRRRYTICTGDRKSTRLNSSHVAISYAVFCLKKKKE